MSRATQTSLRQGATPGARHLAAPPLPPVGRRTRQLQFIQSFWSQERASFRFAWEGLRYSWRTQRHLRIHVGMAALVAVAGVAFSLSPVEWAALVVVIAFVVALELLNTVVEVVVDMVTPDFHPQAKIAKDVAAGGVLVAAAGAALTGAWIFVPHIWPLLRHWAAALQ